MFFYVFTSDALLNNEEDPNRAGNAQQTVSSCDRLQEEEEEEDTEMADEVGVKVKAVGGSEEMAREKSEGRKMCFAARYLQLTESTLIILEPKL
ncbi:Hypothetical predicted protein [Scomber scombrus]|uniref:Uncharacterized protein n=1 Tax=Scomber scombrus TaxID=13677 RepID=A0AAV1Q7T3_SCOSC